MYKSRCRCAQQSRTPRIHSSQLKLTSFFAIFLRCSLFLARIRLTRLKHLLQPVADVLDPALEILLVSTARFDLPTDAAPTVESKAAHLADAMRLTLRRGAGPFRWAALLAFERRTYQLVPLLMAFRLQLSYSAIFGQISG